MILLLGGTTETDSVSRALASRGKWVMVSTATDYPLTLTAHPMVLRRCGALDAEVLHRLIRKNGIVAVVDVTHPYAEVIGPLSRRVAADFGIPYFRYMRPGARIGQTDAYHANGHPAAARIACSFHEPVLLTVGSKNIEVYVRAAEENAVPLYARVLDRQQSIDACYENGLPPEATIATKGPFTVKDNIALIRQFDIGVLVTKESGAAGGIHAKVAAAKTTGCRLVVVDRPRAADVNVYDTIDTMISDVCRILERS
jgi:precorrin-6A/cobalt-precorrin-6A reductase